MYEKWTVYVEIDGKVVWKATYADLGSAQMEQESKRGYYYYHKNALIDVQVWIGQES